MFCQFDHCFLVVAEVIDIHTRHLPHVPAQEGLRILHVAPQHQSLLRGADQESSKLPRRVFRVRQHVWVRNDRLACSRPNFDLKSHMELYIENLQDSLHFPSVTRSLVLVYSRGWHLK